MNYSPNSYSLLSRQLCLCFALIFLSLKSIAQECDFTDVAQSKNITHQFTSGSLAGGVSFIDFDDDGWDDLTFGTSKGQPIETYKNNQGQFEKVTLTGLTNTCEMKQVIWVDFDNDGDKDLYYGCAENGIVLYENDGNLNFTDVTSDLGLNLPDALTFGANWADFDKDGWLDLYITYYGGLRNQLFRNLQGTGFHNISIMANIDPTNKPSFCAVVFDYDHDGWDDIYIANDRSVKNDLIKNRGQLDFADASAASKSNLPMDAMGITLLDINADGFFEIYISNSPEGNALLFNNGDGTFRDITESSGTAFNSVGWGVNTLDIDNDTYSDLYVSGSNEGTVTLSSALYRALDSETFEQTQYSGMTSDTLISYSNAVGDFNNDGKTDIAVSNGGGFTSQLWQNDCVNENNWLRVQLEGTISNRDAIGARAIAWCQGVSAHQYKMAGIGFMAQNADYLHFGLGNFDLVDSLLIVWPSGVIDKMIQPEINKLHKITEGTAALPVPVIPSKSLDDLCNGDEVELSIDIKGRDLQVVWSDDNQGNSTIISENGDYSAIIMTEKTEFNSETVSVNFNELPQVTYEVTPVTNEGQGQITISEVAGPYIYRWSHDAMLNSGTATNLEPGVYSVKITNNSDCDITLNITVESQIITSIDDPLVQSISYNLKANKLYIELPDELRVKLSEAQVSNAQGQILYQSKYKPLQLNRLEIPHIQAQQIIIVRLRFNDRYWIKKLIFTD